MPPAAAAEAEQGGWASISVGPRDGGLLVLLFDSFLVEVAVGFGGAAGKYPISFFASFFLAMYLLFHATLAAIFSTLSFLCYLFCLIARLGWVLSICTITNFTFGN